MREEENKKKKKKKKKKGNKDPLLNTHVRMYVRSNHLRAQTLKQWPLMMPNDYQGNQFFFFHFRFFIEDSRREK